MYRRPASFDAAFDALVGDVGRLGLEPDGPRASFASYIHHDDRPLVLERLSSLGPDRDRFALQYRWIGHDGDVRWVTDQGRVVPSADGQAVVTGFLTPIDVPDLAEHQLDADSQLKRTIIDNVPGGVVFVDTAGAVRVANTVARELLGLSYDVLTRRYIEDFAPATFYENGEPCPVEDYPVARCLGTQRPQPPLTIGVRRPDGTMAWAIFTAVPVRGPLTGEFLGALVTFVDITDRKRVDEKAFQARKMQAIGRVAGGVAHDFNNLLVGILGSAELLLLDARLPDEAKSLTQTIIETAQQAGNLTRQLLGFARQGKYETRPVQLDDLVDELIELLQHSLDKRLRVVHERAEKTPVVMGDPNQLQLVFFNMALNARDAMPDGGTLTFRVRHVAADGVPGAEHVLVDVIDEGVGIPDEVRDKLFEPFVTTREGTRGTGMGLAMAYGIVRNHGGAITVETERGKGTTFSVLLPACDEVPRAALTRAATPASGGRILVVDDEEVARRVAARMLESLGYTAVTANDGIQAIAVFEHAHPPFDLVLLDLVMPEMDGESCFHALRELDRDVRVVLCTGFGNDEAVRGLMDAGAQGLLHKPYRLATMAEIIARAMPREREATTA
ncbi:MAG: response regulator [Myxococcales bacterium]|nr:response regulator [Myxococcales bacterium]MCB9735896.1 response regulator [Deltaproteobacteria bacterium]